MCICIYIYMYIRMYTQTEYFYFWRELKKNLSVIPVYLAFCVHTVWVLLSLLNFTKVSCEGYLKKGVPYKL